MVALIAVLQGALAFVPSSTMAARRVATWPDIRSMVVMEQSRFNNEFEESSRRRASQDRGGGAAETAAGLILGGLLGGPFGALFGASIGSNFGASRAAEKARKEEMQRLGISEDMLKVAQEVGQDLERSIEGLKATRNSLQTQQAFARRLNSNADQLYEKAKEALNEARDEAAKQFLFERQQVQAKLKKALISCAEEKQRLERMERNVQILEEKAMEIETLLRRSVGAKALQDTSNEFLALPNEDPLLKRFRDAGID